MKPRVLAKINLTTGEITNKTIWYYISQVKAIFGLVK